MALADERWTPALAKTAAALLANYRLLQNFRGQFGRCTIANRARNNHKRGPHILNRRKIGGLLAWFCCWPDLSVQLRHGFVRTDHYAGAGL